ncbi:MAG: primase-like protein [Firmicutes bacterium]|nr:primase-like protein [Bacillota bacterium]
MPNKTLVRIDGQQLTLSNLDKVFYPATGFTKGDMLEYYAEVAPAILPHLSARPVTLKRYPGGANDEFFYQKECPAHRPSWLATAKMRRKSSAEATNFCLLEDRPSLLWAVNLAALELHTSLALANDAATPTVVVFDLDPGPGVTILDCAEVALWVRQIFDHYGLQAFPKTSGSKGLQVYIPLNTPTDYTETKTFAHALARFLEKKHPDKVVSNMRKTLRNGKVFIDWSQNNMHKTTVCVYSLRAKDQPQASTPLGWDEVITSRKKGTAEALGFNADQVLQRLKKYGDLFKPVLDLRQKLPEFGS